MAIRRDKYIRYIPTLVGRLSLPLCASSLHPVHPHACGEIYAMRRRTLTKHGTSPRLWGDSISISVVDLSVRYIPTLVGRLQYLSRFAPTSAVHPHACGEISIVALLPPNRPGTSPRLWGDCSARSDIRIDKRYIPTLVGRFSRVERLHFQTAVHPHACGEILSVESLYSTRYGTSPRLWGDSRALIMDYAGNRYIPTLVGRFSQ